MFFYGYTNNTTNENIENIFTSINQSTCLLLHLIQNIFSIQNTTKADLSVRDSAFESLGMLWKCLGEKHILSNLTDLDELKLNKVINQ